MTLESVPVPTPGEHEALVKVAFAGVNFIDVYKRTGLTRFLPATLGEEGAESLRLSGAGSRTSGPATAWRGLRCWDPTRNTSRCRQPGWCQCLQRRTAVGRRDHAAGMTAHYLTHSTFPLKPGDRVLTHAAAGGVGLLLVQIAKARGAYVIATAGSAEKVSLAKAAGADAVIDYTTQDFAAEVKHLTEGKGVHVVYDSVGKSTFMQGFEVLAPRGMMVLFGQSSGVVPPIEPLMLSQRGSLFMTRPTLAHYIATRDELLWRAGDLFD
ncbi:MAG: quinone oxidoreductase [Gemmatimonadaceae bacterium]